MKKYLLMFAALLLITACSNKTATLDKDASAEEQPEEVTEVVEEIVEEPDDQENDSEEVEEEEINYDDLTAEGKILYNILELIDEGRAFDAGSYIPGDIPEGEYVFSSFSGDREYYAEKELDGSIIDNENFDSFGYVHVQGVGNVETGGVLVNIDDLEDVGASGAKEIYEVLNDVSDYNESGWYKVGVDIDAGEYVIESIDRGYVAVMSGPVGNSSIVNNENFNGRFAVSVQDGQYLNISGGFISE